jgi:hypothetical protein
MTVIRGPWPGLTAATKRPAAPPTAEYLQTRERLGMPSQPARAQPAAMQHGCPWCGATIAQPCYVAATGRRLPQPHEARQENHITEGKRS